MSGSFSIILVILMVILSFVATRPVSKRPSRDMEKKETVEVRKPNRRSARSGSGNSPMPRADTLQRLRTDRPDIQTSVGRDFGAPELGDRIWPPTR